MTPSTGRERISSLIAMEKEYAEGIASGHLKGRGSAIGSCCDFLATEIARDLDAVVKPTPSETEATLRELVDVQSARLLKYAAFTRKVVEAADATVKLTDAERLRVIRAAAEAIR